MQLIYCYNNANFIFTLVFLSEKDEVLKMKDETPCGIPL